MIDETLNKIKTRLRSRQSLTPETRKELEDLVSHLESEVHQLSETDMDHAQSIASFADLSTHEATREHRNETTQRLALDGLSATVHGFEGKHPKLVAVVNQICSTLSNMGI